MTYVSLQSRQVILTEDERAVFANKSDEYFKKIGNYLKQFRQNLHALHDNDDADIAEHYEVIQQKQDVYFPNYKNPAEDTVVRVGIRLMAELISRHVTDKTAQMVDVGAGTGYLAVEVKKLGFHNIDCVEPSKNMIANQPEGLFRKIYQEIISSEQPCTIKSGSYDCVMLCGVVYSTHIEVEDFPELLRIVKPGGYIIFSVPDAWFKYKDYGARLDTMLQVSLEKGVLESVVKEMITYMYKVEDATIYVLKKAKSDIHNNNQK